VQGSNVVREAAMVKTIVILVFVVLAGLVITFRQREYVRDPLAKVYRNDVQQDNVEVYQNWANDVLIQQNYGDRANTRILVQDWDEMPGTPANLTCIQWLACVTTDDRAPKSPIAWTGKGKYNPNVTMTKHEVSFVDGDGSKVRVELK
jgi:hypothetical protein